MKPVRYFHVDAFTDRVFAGNPAGVCLLEEPLPDEQLQQMAAEHHLPETAFLFKESKAWAIRWFTPLLEVDLCGHATLASAQVIFSVLEPKAESITFASRSGPLIVRRAENLLVMDFPSVPATPAPAPQALLDGLGCVPAEVLRAKDYLCVFPSEEDIRNLAPRMDLLSRVETRGIIVTAPGSDHDFVSRFFAPGAGILEDPVTGSAHCTLTPYWSKRLGKKELLATQLSRRGGMLYCTDRGDRTLLAGYAAMYMEGRIYI